MTKRIYQPNAESKRTKLFYALASIPALVAVGISWGWLLDNLPKEPEWPCKQSFRHSRAIPITPYSWRCNAEQEPTARTPWPWGY